MSQALQPNLGELLRRAEPFLGSPPDLRDVASVLEGALPAVVDRFYETLARSPEAWAFVGTDTRLAGLRRSLLDYLEQFLAAPPEAPTRARLALRMAQRHVLEQIPLDLTFLAHGKLGHLLTLELTRRWPAQDHGGLAEALGRLQRALSWDATLVVTAYHRVALSRERASMEQTQLLVQQLRAALRSQELLLRATSHELRTPLTGMIGLLGLLRRGVYRDPEQRRSAEADIEDAARHLLALVEDLLHLARLELGKSELHLGEFGAREAADAVARRFMPRYREAGLTLDVAPGAEHVVAADRDRYEQVLSNLLQNALQHTRCGGVCVEVEPLAGAGHVLIRVRDSGSGFDPELAERLFLPFSQGAAARSGLGLGLAICRRLVLRMGGRIRARSDGPGLGSTFEFTLPAAGRRALERQEFGDPAARCRVLLVDDDAAWRTDLGRWLAEELGVRVDATGSVAAALEAASCGNYQLILLDVALPAPFGEKVQDGFSLLEVLGAQAATLLVPKWLVTAHDRGFLLHELSTAGCDAFWSKGEILADRAAFLARVADQLGLRERA